MSSIFFYFLVWLNTYLDISDISITELGSPAQESSHLPYLGAIMYSFDGAILAVAVIIKKMNKHLSPLIALSQSYRTSIGVDSRSNKEVLCD